MPPTRTISHPAVRTTGRHWLITTQYGEQEQLTQALRGMRARWDRDQRAWRLAMTDANADRLADALVAEDAREALKLSGITVWIPASAFEIEQQAKGLGCLRCGCCPWWHCPTPGVEASLKAEVAAYRASRHPVNNAQDEALLVGEVFSAIVRDHAEADRLTRPAWDRVRDLENAARLQVAS